MIYPKLDNLLKKVDSKYTLVILAAKRARQINDYFNSLHKPDLLKGVPPLIEKSSNKALTIALEEIELGKIGYERIREGIK